MKTLISCTWHSNKKRFGIMARNRITWSRKFYEKDYLVNYRFPKLESQGVDHVNFIYISATDNEIMNPDVEKDTIVISGYKHESPKHHDSFAGMAISAQYAYSNNMDWCCIEQDCIVKGLREAIEFASDKNICYGYGENSSYMDGWAEQSFVFVPYFWIPEFTRRLNQVELNHLSNDIPERAWHRTFSDAFTPWPFGHGRKPVTDWKASVFYKQQLTDDEINKFTSM